MDNILFVLIDSLESNFFLSYQNELTQIHQHLKNKLSSFDTMIFGSQDSSIADFNVNNSKELYNIVSKESKGRDIFICDAFSAILSLEESRNILLYFREHYYDICLTENTPKGLIPELISHEFIYDLSHLIPEDKSIKSTLDNLIDYENLGLDVGIYFVSSNLKSKRIDFLPVDKASIESILKLSVHSDFSIEKMEKEILTNPFLLRNYPKFIQIEIVSRIDLYAPSDSKVKEMSLELFQKIINELDEFAPEAVISLGIWGDPFTHSQFSEIFEILNHSLRKVLVQSQCFLLNDEYCKTVISRKNTELIFDTSFLTEDDSKENKNRPYSVSFVRDFIDRLHKKANVWVQLTRNNLTEPYIKLFFKNWSDIFPRIVIKKDDSFGDKTKTIIDLSPSERHSCYSLRREMIILTDGTVQICRQEQNKKFSLGSLEKKTLQELWDKNQIIFEEQEKGNFDSCESCHSCDDWWIWN